MNDYSLRLNGRIRFANLTWREANKKFEKLAKLPGDAILNDGKLCRWIERIDKSKFLHSGGYRKNF